VTLVVDASVVTAALISNDPDGIWAEQVLASDELIAPQLLPVECAATIRVAEFRGVLSPEVAARAYEDLLSLRVALLPFHRFAPRIWELHQNVTPYDAWYVAISEFFDLSLATLDRRLARAPGPRCQFLTP
jgi:predicted nucleic acid-binding protein